MIGGWSPLEAHEERTIWDEFDRRFLFSPSGGRPEKSIDEPTPSVTFDLRGIWDATRPGHADAAIAAIDALARRAFLAEFGEEVELLVLDWQHQGYRLRPAETVAAPIAPDGFPLIPTVVPNGDYSVYVTPDLTEGTFGHPWEQSLCVFGPRMTRTLGSELRAWLPVIRERKDDPRTER